MPRSGDWSRYYDAAAAGPSRDTLVLALDRFDAEAPAARHAVDLGCGEGRDTAEMLRRGWHVLAIDAEPEALRRLRSRADIPVEARRRLTTRVARFERARWPRAQLVNASFALPFCPPRFFAALWGRVVASLPAGGRFSGQLFGERDEWAANPELSFHTRAEVEVLLSPFEVERLDEVEEDGTVATGEPKHWHLFHLVARKR